MVRQVLGAIAQFGKTTTVAKLKAARHRKIAAAEKCRGATFRQTVQRRCARGLNGRQNFGVLPEVIRIYFGSRHSVHLLMVHEL